MPPPSFDSLLTHHQLPPLERDRITTLQVNVGLRCDLACQHCHVEAGPKRSEAMNEALAARVLELLARHPGIDTLDLTGGAPELNPHFRSLVRGARRLGRRVIDRCNLTVLFEPGQEDTADFLAEQGSDIVASLPCTSSTTVDAQRGRSVFERSIAGLRLLNELGYGCGEGLRLDLVYNPLGASLPPEQRGLEDRYRRELGEEFGIVFDHLLTLTNMPIRRFARALARTGGHDAYLELLAEHFNPQTVPELMCRHTLSVAWDGTLYDCDFNQALGLAAAGPKTLFDLEGPEQLISLPIRTAAHCLGCTAGAGSSCGGSLR